MTPNQVNTILPTLTKSRFIPQAQAEKAVKANNCKYLVKGRTYAVPDGQTAKGELKKGAKAIDEWVQIDGGNAYVLTSYKWVEGYKGSTQLHIEFDTMLCK
jgi:hypothetical protein